MAHPSTDSERRRTTKEERLAHPSGVLSLFRHKSVALIVDALLDLPPGREFNKTELATHAGVTRQTVGAHVGTLLGTEVIEEVDGTDPQRYRLAESEVVGELLALNSAINAAGG